MLKYNLDRSIISLAKKVRSAGFYDESCRIMKLSDKGKDVVKIMEQVFEKDLGSFLSQERANNLAMAVLYYDKTSDDLEQYIHDGLMKTNESYYDAERKNKISDKILCRQDMD